MFFEQVTNIVGMRELEDEGKIMAMADYSYPFPIEENKLRDFFSVVGHDDKGEVQSEAAVRHAAEDRVAHAEGAVRLHGAAG